MLPFLWISSRDSYTMTSRYVLPFSVLQSLSCRHIVLQSGLFLQCFTLIFPGVYSVFPWECSKEIAGLNIAWVLGYIHFSFSFNFFRHHPKCFFVSNVISLMTVFPTLFSQRTCGRKTLPLGMEMLHLVPSHFSVREMPTLTRLYPIFVSTLLYSENSSFPLSEAESPSLT